jgi:hypothetical protein
MMTKELAEQVRAELRSLKEAGDKFLETYKQICIHCGGPEWHREEIETVSHHVRREVIPIMEQVGMDHKAVQALCSWAERHVMSR